jgi:cytochrome c
MLRKLVLGLLVMVWPALAAAVQYGTREEAVDMVDRAIAIFEAEGLDAMAAAVMDDSTGEFHDRDLYVFVYTLEGINVAHGANPALVGKDLSGVKDQNGKKIISEMITLTQGPGEGWVDYIWPNPQTKALEPKSAWVKKAGDSHFVGVGVYTP